VRKALQICVFGCFLDSDLYVRNRVLVDCMAQEGRSIEWVRPSFVRTATSHHSKIGSVGRLLASLLEQLRCFCSLAAQRKQLMKADLFFIPYPAYLDRFYLAILTLGQPRRPLILDSFLCLHDTVVSDRQLVRAGGTVAKLVAWLEGVTLRAANCVLIDTQEQRDLLTEQYGLPPQKIVVVPVGIEEKTWLPLPQAPDAQTFVLLFWGTFIPLHGVATILQAAALLQDSAPNVRIKLVGDGQTAQAAASQLKSLKLTNVDWNRQILDTAALRAEIDGAHCVLGVFGTSAKAGNVIPYKLHQAFASNRQVITRSGSAVDALAKQNSSITTVPAGNAVALASAIVAASENYSGGDNVDTRSLYDAYFSNAVIQARLSAVLDTYND
jgi:glycosyltransferase involved in cell wall biosynthesis